MRLFVFNGDMQGNTGNRQNVALYIRIEKKKENATQIAKYANETGCSAAVRKSNRCFLI